MSFNKSFFDITFHKLTNYVQVVFWNSVAMIEIWYFTIDRNTTSFITFRRWTDRKSTRLNSSHVSISYAVFCLKKKIKGNQRESNISSTIELCNIHMVK